KMNLYAKGGQAIGIFRRRFIIPSNTLSLSQKRAPKCPHANTADAYEINVCPSQTLSEGKYFIIV
ncbi:MAG TPA: hypothetical protein PKD13_07165, partial [Mariniflexile sp.]|nr:hypothetical protein [Mariniflexile sp.]